MGLTDVQGLIPELWSGWALENRLKLRGVNRLALEQQPGDCLESSAAVGEDLMRDGLGPVEDGAHFFVNLAGGVLAPGVASRTAAGEEWAPAFVLVTHAAEPGAWYAELGHHLARDLRRPLEIAGAAVGDLAVDDLLGNRAAQQAADRVLEPALGMEEAVVLGAIHRVAERTIAAAEDRDLVDRVGAGQAPCGQGVARLVIRDPLPLVGADHALLLLGAGDDPLDPHLELIRAELVLTLPRGEKGRLVDQVCQVGAHETRGHGGDLAQVDLVFEPRRCGERGPGGCARGR